MRILVGMVLFVSVACVPNSSTGTPAPKNLQSYATITPGSGPTRPAEPTKPAENVVPSPTPFAYTIRAGDTLGQIAEKFNVELDALLAANPDVDPNGMSVGKTLKIPSNQKNSTGESTPTPAPFSLQEVSCHRTSDSGLWCFALARNDSPDTMENITAQITLIGPDGKSAGSQAALLPLNILPPNESLPLSVFFAPGVPADVHPEVQVLTAIRLLPNDPRYLPARIQNTEVQVDWTGLSAHVSGQVVMPSASKPAGEIWIAAVVYDGGEHVAGVRRWESNAGLPAGGSLPFSFIVSSVSGRIEAVDFAVEARP